MEKILFNIAIVLIISIPLSIFFLRYLFKGSILYKIAVLWVINILLFDLNLKLYNLFPDTYTIVFNMPVTILITGLLIYSVYKLIRKPFDDSLNNLERLSNGDLDVSPNKEQMKRNDELGRLSIGIKRLSENLKKTIGGVKNSAEFISEASNELSGSAQQLAEGSNKQAAASEEVSASMEEMVSNIKQNADNSQETEKIAVKASGEMNLLSKSASESISSIKKIADEVKVISDIAFQTNILALNAAIEAAGAGEYGKGFAVVASEVRKLAERSKLAAEKINQLADSSVKITEKTGHFMNKTIPEIDKTVKLVKEINIASNEQNSGAGQINNAIFELNNVTQQNAAGSEEMASSSEELSAQADQLKELISFFKFKDEKTVLPKSISKNETIINKPVIKKNEKKPKIEKTKPMVTSKPVIIDMSDDFENDSEFEKF